MSIVFSGRRGRSRGLISAVIKQVKLVNLQPLSKVTVQFDPFHKEVHNARDFAFHISRPKTLTTNLNCTFKTKVVCDRSDPLIICDYQGSDEKLVIKTLHFNVAELFQIFNQHVSSRVKPVEEEKVSTKVAKKKGGK